MAVDATTQAALEGQVLYWRILCYADFDGDPLRATSSIYDKTVSASGDSELDGTYDAYANNVIEVSPVQHNEDGADTVSISMGGLVVNNAAFLALVGDKTNWQGRVARLWFFCVDEDEAQVGSIIPYYTGYMNDLTISGSPQEQTVTLTIENYLVTLAGASNKTYAMQKTFDGGDNSGSATVTAANGIEGASSGTKTYSPDPESGKPNKKNKK